MWNTIKINILAFPVDLHSSTPSTCGIDIDTWQGVTCCSKWILKRLSLDYIKRMISDMSDHVSKSAGCSWAPPAGSLTHLVVHQCAKRGREQAAKSPNLSTYEAGMGTQMLLLLLPTSQPQIVLSVHKTSQIWRGHRLLPKVWLVLNWSPATGNGSVDWLWWWATI